MEFVSIISLKLGLKNQQVATVLALFEEGATIPFIARYRKDKTGGLDEVQIQQVQDEAKFLKEFTDRRSFIEKAIIEQQKMTPEIEERLNNASSISGLEDIYLPFKTKKKPRRLLQEKTDYNHWQTLYCNNQMKM